jgi:hypothetical protein
MGIDIISSRALFHVDAGVLGSLSFDETTVMSGQGPTPKLGSSTVLKLQFQAQSLAAVDRAEVTRARSLVLARTEQRPVAGSAVALDTDGVRRAGLSLREAMQRGRRLHPACGRQSLGSPREHGSVADCRATSGRFRSHRDG